MNHTELDNRVKKHMIAYKENNLKIFENGTYNQKGQVMTHYRYTLPNSPGNDKIIENFLPMTKETYPSFGYPRKKITLHRFAHHLNSSQVMCLNFFEPLLRDEEGRGLLLKILNEMDIFSISPNSKIIEATFEKVINPLEKTSFDFYIELDTREKLFFEIKYTEKEFGRLSTNESNKDKYIKKWEEVYKPHIAKSLFLKSINKDDFYKNYQVWRNVSYVRKYNEYTIFLYPIENDKIDNEIKDIVKNDSIYSRNVKAIHWEDIVREALRFSEGTKYHSHFDEFDEKYLKF